MNDETKDAVVELARAIGFASERVYADVSKIYGLVNEEAVRIHVSQYVWEAYRDEHRGGSFRPMNRKTRKAVFDAVCYAHSRGMNFAEALNEAVGYRNQRIVGPSLRELLESRAK